MKKNILSLYTLLMLSLPAILFAQYTGGIGRGGVSFAISNSALPVDLISFTGKIDQTHIVLTWQTATEMNNYGFAVERKALNNWEKIGFVNGHGTTNAPQSYCFIDNSPSGKTSYRLQQIDHDGQWTYSPIIEIDGPSVFSLSQNYPNPFNPSTVINYSISSASNVVLKVYNMLGQEVAALVNEQKAAGNYTAEFNGSKLSSGLYFYKLDAGRFSQTKRLILMK